MRNHKTVFLSLVLMLLLAVSGGASAAPPDNRPPNNRPPSGGPPDNRPPDNRPPDNRPPDNRPPGKGGGQTPQEICGDGIDNDGDAMIDEGCTPPPPPPSEICGDGIDNDGDAMIDEGCEGLPDLSLAKVGPTEPVLASGVLQWEILVGNLGEGDAVIPLGTVLMIDYLPQNVTVLNVESLDPRYQCDLATVDTGQPVVKCTALTEDVLATYNQTPDTLRAFRITATAPDSPTTVTNTAEVDPEHNVTESNESNNLDTEFTPVI